MWHVELQLEYKYSTAQKHLPVCGLNMTLVKHSSKNPVLYFTFTGPNLPMATVDIKNPEITTNRFYTPQVNNISYTKEKKKGKTKKRRLTKADIGTPSNFQ